jgi:hypothetical protein
MVNALKLKFAVRASDALLQEMKSVEKAHPVYKGFLEAIIESYDGKILGQPGTKRVTVYNPRQNAGPNEPMHVFSEIHVFLRFDTAVAYVERLLFKDTQFAVGVAKKSI